MGIGIARFIGAFETSRAPPAEDAEGDSNRLAELKT
jgi:hypothetical protein